VALNSWEIEKILWLVKNLALRNPGRKLRILSLGYPDILIEREKLTALVGRDSFDAIGVRENGEAITRAHQQPQLGDYVPEARDLFHAAGADFLTIDIQNFPTTDRVINLNDSLPEDLIGQFDVVIDPGTTEHCFNVAQCMKNISESLVVGGIVFHQVPASYVNHGFFSISPTFFLDYYELNGFLPLFMMVLNRESDGTITELDYRTFEPLSELPRYPMILRLAAMKQEAKQITWPRQRMYGGPSPD
jgi:hypothetical protein